MSFRIGINVGDVIAKEGDIFGDGVNIAARLQMLADAGGICVSRGVRDHIRHLGSFQFEDLGEQQVKNIVRPVRAFRVIADPTDMPEPGESPPEPDDRPMGTADNETVQLDLAMWQTVSGSDRVEEYLHYLEQFPDGEFASLARDRIAALSQARPVATVMPADTAVELSFWDSVKGSDNPALYLAYLEKYPEGNFVLLAKAELDELEQTIAHQRNQATATIGAGARPAPML